MKRRIIAVISLNANMCDTMKSCRDNCHKIVEKYYRSNYVCVYDYIQYRNFVDIPSDCCLLYMGMKTFRCPLWLTGISIESMVRI